MNNKNWLNDAEEMPCPNCKIGTLQWGGNKKTIVSETLESLVDNEYHKNGIIFPYTTEIVSSHLHCNKCNDVVSGTYIRIDDVRNTNPEGDEISIYKPKYFYPAPHIIEIPNSCPITIKAPIELSFLLFWVDLNACANKIRIALEELMNHCEIPAKDQNGGYVSLEWRLREYKKTNPRIGEFLTAIKWIGNASSHSGGITKETVIAGFELLEYSLELAFPDKEQRLTTLSKTITQKKGHV